jgi:hypothetical protein
LFSHHESLLPVNPPAGNVWATKRD